MAEDFAKERTTNLTRFIIRIPLTQQTLFLMFLVSVISGIISDFILTSNLTIIEKILFGGTKGFVIIALPSLFSAVLTTSLARALRTKLKLKRSMFLSFFSSIIFAAIYIIGSFFHGSPFLGTPLFLSDFVIIASSVIFAFRVFVLLSASNCNFINSIPLSLTQPLIAVSMFFALISIEAFEKIIIPIVGPEVTLLLLLFKLLIASSIFVFAVYSVIVIIDAPMRRNFGIGTLEMFKMFLAHWTDKSFGLENLMSDMGEYVDTPLSVIAFKGKKGIKGVFVIPALHPGPFGDIGGANMPTKISRMIQKKFGGEGMVFHGPSSHEMNPVSRYETEKVVKDVEKTLNEIKFGNLSASPLVRKKSGDAKMSVQLFGKSAMLISTFAPSPSEDVDWGVGLAIQNHVHNFEGAFVDAHNCHRASAKYIYDGNPVVFSMLRALDSAYKVAKKEYKPKLRIGFGHVHPNYPRDRGMGDTGIQIAVTEVAGEKTALVLIDGNNLMKGYREPIISFLKKKGLDQAEVCTSDTHTVNAVRGISNPFGRTFTMDQVLGWVDECYEQAVKDMEPVKIGSKRVVLSNIKVFGALHPTEFMSTISSIVATSKIIAPMVIGVSFFLALLSLVLV